MPIQNRTTRVVYKKAKTIPEAERFLREAGIAIKVDYGQMSLDAANAINKRMVEVWQTWKLEQIDRLIPSTGVQGLAHAHGQLIEFNPSKFTPNEIKRVFRDNVSDYLTNHQRALAYARTNPLYSQSHIQDLIDNTRFSRWIVLKNADDAAENLITHEMGHVLHDQLLGGSNIGLLQFKHRVTSNQAMMTMFPQRKPEVQALYDRWRDIYNRATMTDFVKVSNYSRTDNKEYFAESFLMYNVEPQNLPSNVKSFFDDLLQFARKP